MTLSNMSSSLSRSSSVRKSFRLEITLEKTTVATSDSATSLETETADLTGKFSTTKNWGSDPRLIGDKSTLVKPKKSASSGSIAKPLKEREIKRQAKQTMNQGDLTNGASSQKTKPGPITRIKTVIRSTKETIVEKLPGGFSKSSSGSWISRSRPRSVEASQRYGVHLNGNIRPRDASLSPPRERKLAAKVDRSRSFNCKSRVNLDGFVSKRREVWERKSRDSSPERITFSPVDLPISDSKRKSLIKQRTAQLFEAKTFDNSSLPSKKQLLLDLNGRTPTKGVAPKDKPPKPQLKPKRVNLFKRGLPVKPTEAHCQNAAEGSTRQVVKDSETPESAQDSRQTNGEQTTMGKTCSLHQEGGVIEDDYGVDVLKSGYDHCNGIVTSSSPNHSIKSSPDRRSIKHEKENHSGILPSKHRTTSNSSRASTEAVQSNSSVPNGVLTERQDRAEPITDIPDRPSEVRKRQTVATLNGVKLVDDVFVNTDMNTRREPVDAVVHTKVDDDDVFENCDVIEKKQTVATLNGVKLVENDRESEKGGYHFIGVVNKTRDELNELSKPAEHDLESELPEEVSGRLRAAIGKTNLLTTKKFKQFRGLCEENNHPVEGEKVTTAEDLAGFWDMVMLQVDDVKTMFVEIDTMRKNNWQSPKQDPRRILQHKQAEVRSPKRRPRAKPKATTPGSKNTPKDAERAAKAKQQREEARRRLLAAKKAMRRRTLSGSLSDEGAIEIYV